MLHKLKSACFIRKKPTLNKCVCKCFAKVAGLTVRSLNSTGNSFQQLGPATAIGSQTPIRHVARHNKIPTNSGSQSRPTRDCRLPNPWCKKHQGKPERDLQDSWTLACRLYIWHAAGKEVNAVQSRQVIDMWSKRFKPRIRRAAEFNTDCNNCKRDQGNEYRTLLQ